MRRIGISMVVLLALLAIGWGRTAQAAFLSVNEMKAALKTDVPDEVNYIAYILFAVDRGWLPEDLVRTTFLWAKKKPTHKFQYFERGLILRGRDWNKVKDEQAGAAATVTSLALPYALRGCFDIPDVPIR